MNNSNPARTVADADVAFGLVLNATSSASDEFNYATLDPDAANLARMAAAAIRSELRRSFLAVGKHLLGVKDRLQHGQFTNWLEHATGLKPRSAERYMSAARFLAGKNDRLSHLPAALIYALASPKAPTEIVQDVVKAAETGALPSVKEIEARIDAARQQERELELAARRSPRKTHAELRAIEERRRQRQIEQFEADQRRFEREEQARTDRLHLLAERMIAALGDDVAAVLTALNDSNDRETLRRLLAGGAR